MTNKKKCFLCIQFSTLCLGWALKWTVCSLCRRKVEQWEKGRHPQKPVCFHLLSVFPPAKVIPSYKGQTTSSATSPCIPNKPGSPTWWYQSVVSKWCRPDPAPTLLHPHLQHHPHWRGHHWPALNNTGAGPPGLKGLGLLEITGQSTRQQEPASRCNTVLAQHLYVPNQKWRPQTWSNMAARTAPSTPTSLLLRPPNTVPETVQHKRPASV